MKMKKISFLFVAGLMLGSLSCKESEFTEAYPNPAKIAETTIEKQFTGVLYANKDYVLPGYRNYFVTLRTSINHYTQATGWVNSSGQYIPGSSGVEDVWYNYYNMLAQYRELQKIYATKPAEQQADRKIFMLAAAVYVYDYTAKMVDLLGPIPFSTAGLLSSNGGDYLSSSAKFDSAESIYTFLLDDLKRISTELNGITLNAGYQKSFQTQDFLNKGDVTAWKRYTNSLRLRLLNRVSDVDSFKSRSNTEMAEILGNTTTYPIVETNAQNIQINVYDINTDLNSKGFQDGLESAGWYGNTAGKAMIDNMNTNKDPRLSILFEPGANAAGKYIGIDPTATEATQTALFNAGQVAIYNRFTLSRNQFFPGVLINAAQMNLIKAEYYLRTSNDASAKTAYETAIAQSVQFYNGILAITNATGVTGSDKPTAATDASIAAYIAGTGVNWSSATTSADKLKLIATQKWLHYNLVQPYENWADLRRLDYPTLSFQVDNANNQTLPPAKWTIPGNEITYNAANYAAVKSTDNLKTKIFWDVK
ncbi:SusD/RagB family nutrient-binding outer membrane lipoprotein [Spirosoma pollinicola]|uniref:SusD/RagB family nutrient-binding outer membrane lipoprotein n=1 Tax=Spirosoma pollinicola TaxID=2057025 RepID=A0A2K8Z024_9BACT|nr:SusD/RagB family nutrient-binding outer membrane lipoprotein [Spirosoma pollinicola]AUD03232.1 SusD/RagB family nutrient-binding outer membrane lipoprotein [Spirosoma pollinicola]